MTELLDTKPMSETMLLHIAAQAEAKRIYREFEVWARQRQLKDDVRLASILKAWRA